ncbi:MAG: sigma-70 family RNA polymerase sigma factor [Gemmataceae bacterium]
MSSESDRLLIQQIRSNNQEAWTTLMNRFRGRIFAFAYRRLQDHTLSEDVVQETFFGFLRSLPNFDEKRPLESYLFSIASNQIINHHRKNGRNLLHGADTQEESLGEQAASDRTVSSHARSAERRQLEENALAESLRQLLRQWREKGDWTRLKVMELLWVKGLPNREVAQLLKLSEQQIANYRFAATRKLGEMIRNAGLSADVFPELYEAASEEGEGASDLP